MRLFNFKNLLGLSIALASSFSASAAENSKTLIAYYSASGNTKAVAQEIANELKADLFEITPKVPYSLADLNYNDEKSRVCIEHESNARPEFIGNVNNFEQYDTILIGYPIWWANAPQIVYTFIESNSFKGKTW